MRESYDDGKYCQDCGFEINQDTDKCEFCKGASFYNKSDMENYDLERKKPRAAWMRAAIFFIILSMVATYSLSHKELIAYTLTQFIDDKIIYSESSHEVYAAGNAKTSNTGLYDYIYSQLSKTPKSITVDRKLGKNVIIAEFLKVAKDNPNVMYLEKYSYNSKGTINLYYSIPIETVRSRVKAMNDKADIVAKDILSKYSTEYERQLAVHDYIVNNCKYDKENYDKQIVTPEANTAYGALIQGKALCGGYSYAMKLLCNKVGIDCKVIMGSSKGELHAWNVVKIDGGYYHVDATWNSPTNINDEKLINHFYFNLTDTDISKDHTWNKGEYPYVCNSTKYNYYYLNNCVVEDYNSYLNYIVKKLDSGEKNVCVRVKNMKAGEDLEVGLKYALKISMRSLSCKYLINSQLNIIEIEIT